MIVIGERLNSSKRQVLEALRRRDEAYVLGEARAQRAAGADYVDLNAAALLGSEVETLAWAVPLIQEELGIELAIDTPSADAMETAIRLHKGRAMLNSLTGEADRLRRLLPVIRECKPKVIALCMDEGGVPATAGHSLEIARRIVDVLEKDGVPPEDVFLDPLVRPVGVDEGAPRLFLESLRSMKKHLPGARTVAGISNVSFGLPLRRLLNRTLLVLALEQGLDAAILDPLDKEMMASLAAGRVLLGQDASYKAYLRLARSMKPRK
jgi:5-methyltetrahydrofolate--homocysteine methyltransferase